MNDATDGDLKLAFSLAAIDRLADPAAAVADAEAWSQWLGVIDDDTERVERTVAEYGLRQDFEMADRDWWYALDEISDRNPTARHVYVGAGDREMRVSSMFGWEYVRVTEAAENAGWGLAEPQSDAGISDRLSQFIAGLLR